MYIDAKVSVELIDDRGIHDCALMTFHNNFIILNNDAYVKCCLREVYFPSFLLATTLD